MIRFKIYHFFFILHNQTDVYKSDVYRPGVYHLDKGRKNRYHTANALALTTGALMLMKMILSCDTEYMKRNALCLTLAAVTLFAAGCGLINDRREVATEAAYDEPVEILIEPEQEILTFVSAHGGTYRMVVDPFVERHTYNLDCFIHDGDKLSYTGDPRYGYRLGVDVSRYQGSINWDQVRDDGYDFAILRLGYRGYGTAGSLNMDSQFYQNLNGAKAAGLDVGVYFFAQAINEEEAREEADYVLSALNDAELELPVVYDPESVTGADARTDDVTGEQFTRNTLAFCQTIEEAGYEAMVYSNMLWEAYELDLKELTDYPIWYADYEPLPQTPYRFEFWQYTSTGRVNGIRGDVDINIWLIPTE